MVLLARGGYRPRRAVPLALAAVVFYLELGTAPS
jgi:hypothetical protein